MTSSSSYGYYVDIGLSDGGCDDNQPLSACYAFDLINNARHLRDESTQYRVNFLGGYFTSELDGYQNVNQIYVQGTNTQYKHVITQIFPWQQNSRESGSGYGPRSPVLRINAASDSSTVTFHLAVYMMGFQNEIGYNEDSEHASNGYAWEWTGTTTTTEPSWVIQSVGGDKTGNTKFYIDALTKGRGKMPTWGKDLDGTTQWYDISIYMYRLSIYAKGGGHIYGVSLREFSV
jgi:hypothetical protein